MWDVGGTGEREPRVGGWDHAGPSVTPQRTPVAPPAQPGNWGQQRAPALGSFLDERRNDRTSPSTPAGGIAASPLQLGAGGAAPEQAGGSPSFAGFFNPRFDDTPPPPEDTRWDDGTTLDTRQDQHTSYTGHDGALDGEDSSPLVTRIQQGISELLQDSGALSPIAPIPPADITSFRNAIQYLGLKSSTFAAVLRDAPGEAILAEDGEPTMSMTNGVAPGGADTSTFYSARRRVEVEQTYSSLDDDRKTALRPSRPDRQGSFLSDRSDTTLVNLAPQQQEQPARPAPANDYSRLSGRGAQGGPASASRRGSSPSAAAVRKPHFEPVYGTRAMCVLLAMQLKGVHRTLVVADDLGVVREFRLDDGTATGREVRVGGFITGRFCKTIDPRLRTRQTGRINIMLVQ